MFLLDGLIHSCILRIKDCEPDKKETGFTHCNQIGSVSFQCQTLTFYSHIGEICQISRTYKNCTAHLGSSI